MSITDATPAQVSEYARSERELVVLPERLALVVRAHAPGEVGPAGQRRERLGHDRPEQLVVAGLQGEVGRAGGEVESADGVTGHHRGLADGLVVLVVLRAELDVAQDAVAPPVDEPTRTVEVAALPGEPVELDERDLDLGVAVDALDAVRSERLADVVRVADREPDELVLAVRPGTGDRRLDEVAGAVQLVAPLQVGVPVPLARAAPHGVEVAVGLLHRSDPRDQRPEAGVHRGVPGAADLPGHGLHELVDVGVGELPAAASAGQPAA